MLRRALLAFAVLSLAVVAPAGARVAPVAALSGPATMKAGTKVTFDATSSTHDPAGSIVEYAWDLDGSGTFDDIRKTPTITTVMDTPGDVTIAVRVRDDAGLTSVAVGHFFVEGPPPVARLSVPSPVVAGVPVTLDASASTASSGTLVGYDWDLDGNGFAFSDPAPTLPTTFAASGAVTVKLRVRDSAGGQDVLTRTIDVVAPGQTGPAGAIGGAPEFGVAPLDAAGQKWIRVGSNRHFAAINGVARRGMRAVRAHGLWVNLLADRAARFALGVFVDRASARRLHLTGPVVGQQVRIARVATRLRAAGQRPFRIVLGARVRASLHAPLTLLVRGTATDARGRRSPVSRAFGLRG
jgi:hypothetical protein